MDDQEQKARDRVIRSLGAGYLVRWDQHDPDALKQEVGPVTRRQAAERELVLEPAWFD